MKLARDIMKCSPKKCKRYGCDLHDALYHVDMDEMNYLKSYCATHILPTFGGMVYMVRGRLLVECFINDTSEEETKKAVAEIETMLTSPDYLQWLMTEDHDDIS